jgi:hypothetical protein
MLSRIITVHLTKILGHHPGLESNTGGTLFTRGDYKIWVGIWKLKKTGTYSSTSKCARQQITLCINMKTLKFCSVSISLRLSFLFSFSPPYSHTIQLGGKYCTIF